MFEQVNDGEVYQQVNNVEVSELVINGEVHEQVNNVEVSDQ